MSQRTYVLYSDAGAMIVTESGTRTYNNFGTFLADTAISYISRFLIMF